MPAQFRTMCRRAGEENSSEQSIRASYALRIIRFRVPLAGSVFAGEQHAIATQPAAQSKLLEAIL